MRNLAIILSVLALLISALACNLPDPAIDVLENLPTLTPTSTLAPTSTLFVSTTGNDSHDCLTAATACLTIEAAVHKAPNGALINIGPGTFAEVAYPEGVMIRDQDLSLRGAGTAAAPTTIISGGNSRNALSVINSGNVVIENVILSDGGTSHGGIGVGLDVTGTANVTLRNSIVQANSGAGVDTLGSSTVILEGDTISANDGGGINNLMGIVNVRASRIVSNHGTSAIYSRGHLTISDTTISGNRSRGPGTAILNGDGGFALIERSTISANRVPGSQPDFAVYNYSGAQMTVVNTTISGNGFTGIQSFGTLSIIYSTIVRNGALGLFANSLSGTHPILHIDNSIIEENGDQDCSYQTGAATTFDFTGRIISDGSCVFTSGGPFVPSGPRTADAFLGPLASNGGPTMTHALLPGSAAIDSASATCMATDQRGIHRPMGGGCDVGAFEHDFASTYATAGPEETATVTETVTPAGLPKETAAPTETATLPAAPQATFVKNGNCRKGPGTGYNIVTSLKQGQQASPDGRDAQNLWVDILVPNTQAHCWVALTSLTLNVPVETLALLPLPPLPDAPATVSRKAQCVIKLKSLTVKLTWSDVANESGYHIYRNGTLIETTGANVTTYMDGSAPLGTDLTYEVEAFNANGSSARTQTTVSACK